VSLLLLSFFTILVVNANNVVNSIREKVEMEAFLDEPITQKQIDEIKATIEMIVGVKEVRFVSKEDAAKIFQQEFGEDIHKVLDFNPLPPSFKIYLKEGYKTSREAQEINDKIRGIKGINEVIYKKQLLEMLDQHAMWLLWISFGAGIFITISSIILVANTIRLAIYAKRKIIQTMKLIGATKSFIRLPFLIEGFIQGFVGGVLAAAVLAIVFALLQEWLTVSLYEFVQVKLYYYAIIILIGCCLGLLGSMISIRRFISENVCT